MSTTVVINGSLPLVGVTFALTIVVAWMLIRVLRWLWDLAGICPVRARVPKVSALARSLRPATVAVPPGVYNPVTGDYSTGGKHRKVSA